MEGLSGLKARIKGWGSRYESVVDLASGPRSRLGKKESEKKKTKKKKKWKKTQPGFPARGSAQLPPNVTKGQQSRSKKKKK